MRGVIARWLVGLVISLFAGHWVTSLFVEGLRERHDRLRSSTASAAWHGDEYVPAWITGIVERTFFTVAVGFNVSGAVVAMIAWTAAKMAVAPGAERADLAALPAIPSRRSTRGSRLPRRILSGDGLRNVATRTSHQHSGSLFSRRRWISANTAQLHGSCIGIGHSTSSMRWTTHLYLSALRPKSRRSAAPRRRQCGAAGASAIGTSSPTCVSLLKCLGCTGRACTGTSDRSGCWRLRWPGGRTVRGCRNRTKSGEF